MAPEIGPKRFETFGKQGPVSQKSRKLFRPEKPFVKLRPANSEKPVFSYVVKGIKIKITGKFRASRRLRFEDTKRIMSSEMRAKSVRTFEKRAENFSAGYGSLKCLFAVPFQRYVKIFWFYFGFIKASSSTATLYQSREHSYANSYRTTRNPSCTACEEG